MALKRFYIDHPRDNAATALEDLPAGAHLHGVSTAQPIPFKHKFALINLQKGEHVIMYGVPVGRATCVVPAGGLLHRGNLAHDTAGYALDKWQPASNWQGPDIRKWISRAFEGYQREDGRVGTANHWLVIPLVFCENRNVQVMQDAVNAAIHPNRQSRYAEFADSLARLCRDEVPVDEWPVRPLPDQPEMPPPLFPNIDGIKFLTHSLGCGGTRQDAQTLCGLLAGYICHPNVGGVTVLSLGCQNAEVEILESELARRCPGYKRPFRVFEQQKSRSEPELIQAALTDLFKGLVQINRSGRETAPLSKLTIGLECGGSDGLSGITANPCVGRVSDRIVALGGSVILSEFPELCGIEQDLIDRCTSMDLAGRFCHLMESYASLARQAGSGFDMNPSPGNIADGIVTDAMKSAGAARKGGTSPVTDVLDYPDQLSKPGLNLLCTPGGDVESTTAMVGAGANVVLFTTGLGTPTGNPVAPVIKISSNRHLATRMPDLIDFDAGGMLSGNTDPELLADELLAYVVAVASGEATPHAVRLGQDDFIPWKRGPSL